MDAVTHGTHQVRAEPPQAPGAGDEFVEDEVLPPGNPVRAEPLDPGKWREATRAALALGLVSLLAVTILLITAATVLGGYPVSYAKDLFCSVLAPLVGLVGAATGFYYGGKTH